jgi:hypothetical protein
MVLLCHSAVLAALRFRYSVICALALTLLSALYLMPSMCASCSTALVVSMAVPLCMSRLCVQHLLALQLPTLPAVNQSIPFRNMSHK